MKYLPSTKWIHKSSISVIEQGILSGTHFVVGVLMGRWLTPSDFGAFSISYTIFLFFSGIQNALILEPMSVLGPSNFPNALKDYLGKNAQINRYLWLSLTVLTLVISVLVKGVNSRIASAIFGLSLAFPFMATYGFIRRRMYVLLKPSLPLAWAILYSGMILFSLGMLNRFFMLSPIIGFFTIGLASMLVVVLDLVVERRKDLVPPSLLRGKKIQDVIGVNWEYGRWIFAGTFLFWFVYLSYIPLTGILLDLESAGAYRALQNLTVPVDRVLSGIGLLILPAFAFKMAKNEIREVTRIAEVASIAAGIMGIGYLSLITIFRRELVQLLYDQELYVEYAGLVPIIGLVSVLNAIGFGYSHGLRASGHSKEIFLSLLWGALLTIVVSIPATISYGLLGAVFIQFASAILSTVTLVYYWRKSIQK